MKKCRVHTIQMSQWRLIKDSDIVLNNITFKTNDPLLFEMFAPESFADIIKIKNEEMIVEAFAKNYIKKLDKSSKTYKKEWIEFLSSGDIALACFCSPDNFCHRYLLAEYLKEFGEKNGIDVLLAGEIKKEEKSNDI